MIEVDASRYREEEGGKEILRMAYTLSAMTKKPCRIFNIQQEVDSPGLTPQHLLEIRALSKLCHGRLEEDKLGSEEIKFFPGELCKEKIFIRVPMAGSLSLILETLIPAALFSKRQTVINLQGGATETFFSPTIDYFRFVFLKILEKIGIKTEVNIIKRGYYPGGKAEISLKVYSWTSPRAFSFTERGELQKVLVISGASESLKKKKVAERQIMGVKEILGKLKLPIKERIEYYQTASPGSQICLIAEFENAILGQDGLGKFEKRAEEVGREAALNLLEQAKTDVCLDKYIAKQILPYMAFGSKISKIITPETTNHYKASIWVIEKFLKGRFEIDDKIIAWNPAHI